MSKAKLLWVDLEMTGLVPGEDKILEVAAVATDWDFEEMDASKACFSAIVKVPEELMRERIVGEFWEKNAESRRGLMEQNGRGKSAEEVEEELLGFCDEWFGKEIILAGNSIHQDRRFIEKEWPRLNARLHYRMLDVSAWKMVFEGRYGMKYRKKEAHRAMEDIRESIEELKWYMNMIDISKSGRTDSETGSIVA